MNSYTMLWSQETIRRHEGEGWTGRRLTHKASNRFTERGIQSGDRIYSVGTRDGDMILIGALTVGEIVTSAAARARLPYPPYLADEHIFEVPGSGTPVDFYNVLPRFIVRRLRFRSGAAERGLVLGDDGRLDRQTLRAMRLLADRSAALLEERLR